MGDHTEAVAARRESLEEERSTFTACSQALENEKHAKANRNAASARAAKSEHAKEMSHAHEEAVCARKQAIDTAKEKKLGEHFIHERMKEQGAAAGREAALEEVRERAIHTQHHMHTTSS